jgi:hypothetical protein
LPETFFCYRKNWARCDQKCILVFTFSTRYSCQILMEIEFSWQTLKKYQISWKSIQWEPSCSMQKDRQTDMMKLIVALQNFMNAPKSQLRITNHVTHTYTLLLNPEYSNYFLVMLVWDTIIIAEKNVAANEGFPVHSHTCFVLQTDMCSSKRCPSSHTVTYVRYRQLTVTKIHLHCLWTELGANNVHWQRQKVMWYIYYYTYIQCATTQNMAAQHTWSSHISLRRSAFFLLHFRNGRPNGITCCIILEPQF